MNMPISDLIWGFIGFFLSLLVFSYLIGDNPLFRFVIHLFTGVSAGVVSVIILYQVLYPRLVSSDIIRFGQPTLDGIHSAHPFDTASFQSLAYDRTHREYPDCILAWRRRCSHGGRCGPWHIDPTEYRGSDAIR